MQIINKAADKLILIGSIVMFLTVLALAGCQSHNQEVNLSQFAANVQWVSITSSYNYDKFVEKNK